MVFPYKGELVRPDITFGEYLRECRLKAGYGLRSFAVVIGMQPSNLSNIEHGRLPPPQDAKVLEFIAETLGLSKGSKTYSLFFDLAVKHKGSALPPDVASYAEKTPGIPALLRTIENKKLSKKELQELAEYIGAKYTK